MISYTTIDDIFDDFCLYVSSQIPISEDILAHLIDNNFPKQNDYMDEYFSKDYAQFYNLFYTFISSIKISHSLYCEIDSKKMIEHAICTLVGQLK